MVMTVGVCDTDGDNDGAGNDRYNGGYKKHLAQREITAAGLLHLGGGGNFDAGRFEGEVRFVTEAGREFENTSRVYVSHFIHRNGASGAGDGVSRHVGDGTGYLGAVGHLNELIAAAAVESRDAGAAVKVDITLNGIACLSGFKNFALQLRLLGTIRAFALNFNCGRCHNSKTFSQKQSSDFVYRGLPGDGVTAV